MKIPKAKKIPSGMWRVQVMADGIRRSVTAETEELAIAQALSLKAGLTQAKEQEKVITLTAAIDSYINSRDNVLSPSTINGYREIQRNRFQGLMKRKTRDIDEKALQEAVNLEAKKVGHKTIKNALGLVGAVVTQYRPLNMKRIRLPQRIRKEHKFLDAAGIMSLFEAVDGSPVELPILLGVWLGMRRSEILGLCWDCVKIRLKISCFIRHDIFDKVHQVRCFSLRSHKFHFPWA